MSNLEKLMGQVPTSDRTSNLPPDSDKKYDKNDGTLEINMGLEVKERRTDISEEKKPEEGELKIDRQKWAELARSLKNIVIVLMEREAQRMSLIEPQELGQLAGAVNQFESLSQKDIVKDDDFGNVLRNMINGLRAIGDVPKQSVIREDEDSLTKVYTRLARFRNEIDNIRGTVSGDEEAVGSAAALTNALIEASENAIRLVAKKRRLWREYLGR